MIQVKKTVTAPKELATKGYRADEVAEQILADQNGKCYLCERAVGTDYEIEHLQSKSAYPLLMNEWHNLLIACGYCNRRKSNDYDEIVHPVDVNIESIIEQRLDVMRRHASFVSVDQSESVIKTIELLEVLHNDIKNVGSTRLRTRRYMNEICSKYADFILHVDAYLEHPTPKAKEILLSDLKPTAELLGFKRQFLKDCGILTDYHPIGIG